MMTHGGFPKVRRMTYGGNGSHSISLSHRTMTRSKSRKKQKKSWGHASRLSRGHCITNLSSRIKSQIGMVESTISRRTSGRNSSNTGNLRSTCVGVSNKHRLVNLYLLRVRLGWCTKGHKVYTGLGRMSLRPVCCCSCY